MATNHMSNTVPVPWRMFLGSAVRGPRVLGSSVLEGEQTFICELLREGRLAVSARLWHKCGGTMRILCRGTSKAFWC